MQYDNPMTELKVRLGGECHPAKQVLKVLDRVENIERIVREMLKGDPAVIPVKKMGRPKGSKNKE